MIDKIGAGHYQTRDGRPVVILCLDVPGTFPVVGYVRIGEENPTVSRWKEDGSFYSEGGGSSDNDLIPVQRKPREVWISNASLKEAEEYDRAFLNPGYLDDPVLFREVMEDENA